MTGERERAGDDVVVGLLRDMHGDLGRRVDAVETNLGARIERVETKVDATTVDLAGLKGEARASGGVAGAASGGTSGLILGGLLLWAKAKFFGGV